MMAGTLGLWNTCCFMHRRFFLQGAALLACSALAAPAGVVAALLPANPVFGRSLPALQGGETPLSSWLGQPVLMNFWASWCAPCVRELPLLQSLHERYPDLAVLGLAVDTQANVQRFIDKVPVSYPLLLTGTQGVALMRELGNKSGVLPFSVLFDRDGHVADRLVGELQNDDIQTRIEHIL